MCTASDMTSPLAVDFAGSDALLTASDYSQYPDLQMYPTMAGAVVPIFNLGSITNLTFPTFLLAKVFAGTVRYWDDASILALNPHLNGSIPSNQPIILVVRSDSSGTTQIFKKALAAFDSAFRSQIGTASSNVWTNVTATQRSGNQGVVSYVMSTKYTLGYSELGVALTNNLPMVKLQKANGSIVTASITSTDYAVLEMGLSFGNNGDDAARLTADLEDAQGSNAWPIVGYTYLVMRKSTLRSGATCENVRQTVAFWYWFWTSKVAANIVEEDKFLALPSVVLDVVLSRFVADITCNGQVVYEKTVLVPVNGQGTDLVSELFTTLVNVYSLVDSTVNLTFTADDSSGYAADTDLVRTMFSASTNSALGAPPNGYKLIFAGAGLAVISQVNVTLNGLTLAQILQGDITTWLDPAIAALNPWGVRDANGAIITNTSHQIQLLQGPSASSASLQSLMTAFLSTYTGAAILGAPMSASEDILRYSVLGSPWALSITPYTGTFPAGLQLVPYRHSDGSVVDPSWQAIKACASDDTFVTSLNSFQLASSQLSSCYPLALSVHIRVRKSQCDTVNDAPRTAAANLIGWMFSNAALKNALQAANLAPLTDANVAATAANQAVLDAISCSTASSSGFPFFIIIVMCAVGGVFLLLIPALVWHSTRRMRALRKQFSNDNVAQECAAAIARFDLESVVWLNELKNPNKIQTSFVQIVHILTEVKPFIPDQLLQQLTGQGEGRSEHDGEDRASESKQRVVLRRSVASSASHAQKSNSRPSTVASSDRSASDGEGTPRRKTANTSGRALQNPSGPPRAEAMAAQAMEAEQKWTRKRCAWLCAELKSDGSLDDPTTLAELSTVVTSLVAVAKKFGATIERVGAETVIVHWGLSGHVAQAAQRATLTGMEMSAVTKQKFACLQVAFRLRIGITYGMCHVTTLSASGHRFFLSAGTEMSLATRLVHDSVFDKCHCTVLVSHTVHKEVQYSIKCLPRAWFGDALVWEPIEDVKRQDDDEWMYELRKMESAEGAVSKDRALLEVFGMMSPTASPKAIQEAADALREQHGESLTREDTASLDLLVASLDQLLPISIVQDL
eukprot:GGOE01031918.1.p1 GENE.GGOE01031918.1~~GGOE01031918.1.p1  ORF type:complete len:1162 (-),score=353.87 GGOE01031918.1:686-3928(-)